VAFSTERTDGGFAFGAVRVLGVTFFACRRITTFGGVVAELVAFVAKFDLGRK
jgi:hypothetical protein